MHVAEFVSHVQYTCDTNKQVHSATTTTTQQHQHQPPHADDDNSNEGGRWQVRWVGLRHVLVCVSSPGTFFCIQSFFLLTFLSTKTDTHYMGVRYQHQRCSQPFIISSRHQTHHSRLEHTLPSICSQGVYLLFSFFCIYRAQDKKRLEPCVYSILILQILVYYK